MLGSQIAKKLIIPQTDFKSFFGGGRQGTFIATTGPPRLEHISLCVLLLQKALAGGDSPWPAGLTSSRAGGPWLQPPATSLLRIGGDVAWGSQSLLRGVRMPAYRSNPELSPVRRLPRARGWLRVSAQQGIIS